jgi:hypothetical protein
VCQTSCHCGSTFTYHEYSKHNPFLTNIAFGEDSGDRTENFDRKKIDWMNEGGGCALYNRRTVQSPAAVQRCIEAERDWTSSKERLGREFGGQWAGSGIDGKSFHWIAIEMG